MDHNDSNDSVPQALSEVSVRSLTPNDKLEHHSPEKIIVNPIGFDPNVSVSDSASPMSHKSPARPKFIPPEIVPSPEPAGSPLNRSSVSQSGDIGSAMPQQDISSVEQSFVAEAEQLVQSISKAASSRQEMASENHENSNGESQRVDDNGAEKEQQEEEHEQQKPEEDEQQQEEDQESPAEPLYKVEEQEHIEENKVDSEAHNQDAKSELSEKKSKEGQPAPALLENHSHLVAVKKSNSLFKRLTQSYAKPNASKIVPDLGTMPIAKTVSQAEYQQLTQSVNEERLKTDRQDLSQSSVSKKEMSQLSQSITKQEKDALLMSQVSRKSIGPQKIDLEKEMRTVMGPRENSQAEKLDSDSPSEKQAIEGLMLKEGRQISTSDGESKSGLEKIALMKGLCFRQKFEVLSGIAKCQYQHRTYVHDYIPATKTTGEPMFKCNEDSTFCSRQCLTNSCRPFSITVNVNKDGANQYEPFLKLDRDCSYGCLWFNRPTVSVRLIENGMQTYLGKIKDAYRCGDIVLEIYDHDDILRYVIEGNCCQCGMMCNCYCDSCQTVDFMITPGVQGRLMSMQQRSGKLSELNFPNADKFVVGFNETITPEEKALMLSAILFLEARHFAGDP